MTIDEKYMYRCLQLAQNGRGYADPNPMVGAVIVHNGKIIGEGYHRRYGEAHAEVNAVNNVKDPSLLKESTIYVSLEPCSHYGKTPPCSQLIIDKGIPRVVIACLDPFPEVSGRGVKMLLNAGIDVKIGVLEKEAWMLNKEFFTAQTKKRPYIYLKWAQTKDGYIDKERGKDDKPQPTPISNSFCRMLVHKKRAEVSAIMVGTNTAITDNPSLTTRFWYGKNPIRVVLDRKGRIPYDYNIFDGKVKTIIFTEKEIYENANNGVKYIRMDFDGDFMRRVFEELKRLKVNSILVEGGRELLQNLIDAGLWDEANIEVSAICFEEGVKAPVISGNIVAEYNWGTSKQVHLSTLDYHKIL